MKDISLDRQRSDAEEEDGRSPWALALRVVLVVVALAVAVLVWRQVQQAGDEAGAPPEVQQVTLLEKPPPPPEEELPEPEPMEIEEMETIEEVVDAEEPPLPDASEQLGLIGDGVAGADAFGLRSRRSGIDAFQAMRNGSGGGGLRRAHQRWSEGVGNSLRDTLEREDAVRMHNYRVELRMRFADSGAVEDCKLVTSTGDREIDSLIRTRCEDLHVPPPPADFPQPLRLGVNVRGVR